LGNETRRFLQALDFRARDGGTVVESEYLEVLAVLA